MSISQEPDPDAWGVLWREGERLKRRGRALSAGELPPGIDTVESLESSIQNDKINEPQEARDVGMDGLTPEEFGMWVRQERVMHLREQRALSARLAEAVAVWKAMEGRGQAGGRGGRPRRGCVNLMVQ